MGFCTSCGAPLQKDALFCTVCGAKIAAPSAPPARPETPLQDYSGGQPLQAVTAPAPVSPQQAEQPERPAYFGGGEPPRQAHNGGYAPAPPVYPTYRQPGSDWGRYNPPPKKPARKQLKHKGALRFFSVLFAFGLLVFAAGLSTGMYYSRFVDESLDGYMEMSNDTEPVKTRQKEHFAAMVTAAMTKDVRNAMIEGAKFQDPDADTAYIDRKTAAELEPTRNNLTAMIEAGKKEYGIRWTLLEIGLKSELLKIAGGILAGLSLLLWFALGGRASNLSRAANTPLLTMFIIWGICFVILALVIPPANFFSSKIVEAVMSDETSGLRFPIPFRFS